MQNYKKIQKGITQLRRKLKNVFCTVRYNDNGMIFDADYM